MTMKIKHILTAMLALAAVSCEQAKFGIDEPVSDNMLKVRFATPELEVKSGSEDVSFYAYLTSELKAGTIAPIAATMQKEDGYLYYNIPEGTTDVIFSNISGTENELVMFTNDSDGGIKISLKNLESHAHIYNDEILIGQLSDFTTGTSEAYNIDIQRLSSTVTTNLLITDADGNVLPNDNIASATIWYYGFAQSLTLTDDLYSITGDEPEGHTYSGWSLDRTENTSMTNTHSFIPSSLEPRIEVNVWDLAENHRQYSTVLSGITFEPNHHYTVNLRLKQLNVEGTFVLEEPSVSTVSRNPNYSKQDFFTLSEGRTVGGYADDVLTINVSTALPYDWYISYPEEANSFFDIQVIDGQIVIRALATNENDIRSVDIEILTNEGYSKTITVNQKSSLKHRIVMTSEHDYSYSYICVSGENITLQDPNDSNPRTFSGENQEIYLDGLTKGSQIVIEGDVITYFAVNESYSKNYTDDFGYTYPNYDSSLGTYYYYTSSRYNFTYNFENCLYLKELIIQGHSADLDLTGMKSLKRVHIQNSACTSITIDEGSPIEHFTAYNCDALTSLDLRNVASSIKYINCSDSDALSTINFTNFTELKSVNINGCDKTSNITLTGCKALEELSIYNNSASVLRINNCTSLKDIYLNSMALTTMTHDGADALENISGYSTTITTLDLSNKQSLKIISNLNCTTFNVSGCSNLEEISKITDINSFNINNCTSLRNIDVEFYADNMEQTYYMENCTSVEKATFDSMSKECDFSLFTNIKEISITNITGHNVTSIDLGNNTLLENITISADGRYAAQNLNSIIIPESTNNLSIDYIYGLKDFDISGSANLKSLKLDRLSNLNNLNLSDCTSLESFDIRRSCKDYNNSGTIDLSNCQALKEINRNYDLTSYYDYPNTYITSINLNGCTSLEYMMLYDSNLTELDFSSCSNMKEFDIRYNNLNTEAIDAMFVSLPDKNEDFDGGSYRLTGNPGANSYDVNAAIMKNWNAIN